MIQPLDFDKLRKLNEDTDLESARQFMLDITKPLYVFRMANAQLVTPFINDTMKKSARTRALNAAKEIESVINLHATIDR